MSACGSVVSSIMPLDEPFTSDRRFGERPTSSSSPPAVGAVEFAKCPDATNPIARHQGRRTRPGNFSKLNHLLNCL